LLEENVRTFLQFRGDVNKGIRITIQKNPSFFFAYNNGITATTATFSANLSVLGRIILNLPNYPSNTDAKNAGLPVGVFYRTGEFVNIVV
jgi:hypothetical protein